VGGEFVTWEAWLRRVARATMRALLQLGQGQLDKTGVVWACPACPINVTIDLIVDQLEDELKLLQ
jgi:hypothetical protein